MDLFKGSTPHRPLSQDEIRLVVLSPGVFDDPIICQLEHVRLATHRGYLALSYCWGNPNITTPISLNGCQYPVTSNLDQALRYLRYEHEYNFLWIDSLCINQLDLHERSQQVQRMKDIYLEATRVVVWVGGYAPYTKEEVDAAFEVATRMNERLLDAMKQVHLGKFGNADTVDVGKFIDAVRNQIGQTYFSNEFINDNSSALEILREIIQRPWFSRVWVIQEVAVSKTFEVEGSNGPAFVCGWSKMPFWWLVCVALHLNSYASLSDGSKPGLGMIFIYGFRHLHNELAAGRTSKTLAEQLSIFLSRSAKAFQATDERDKIYAFLGLLSYDVLPSCLSVNYTLAPERVFKDYAVYILQETGNLDILACCSFRRPSLPSWVPDWSRTASVENFPHCKGSHLRFLCGDNKIEVDCLILSRITTVLPPLDIHDFLPELKEHGIMSLECHTAISNLAKDTCVALIYYEQKLFGNLALHAGLSKSRLEKWINALTAGFDVDTDAFYGSLSVEKVYRMFWGNQDDIEAILHFCNHIRLRFQYATYEDDLGDFSIPRDKDDLPNVGDVVCFLKGSEHKFILRPEGDEWRLVGARPCSQEKEKEEHEMLAEYCEFWDRNAKETKRIIIH
jgi:hypothetical protein